MLPADVIRRKVLVRKIEIQNRYIIIDGGIFSTSEIVIGDESLIKKLRDLFKVSEEMLINCLKNTFTSWYGVITTEDSGLVEVVCLDVGYLVSGLRVEETAWIEPGQVVAHVLRSMGIITDPDYVFAVS